MKFRIINEEVLPDSTRRLRVEIDKKDLIYMGYILESWEGFCNYTTIYREKAYLQIDVMPDFYKVVKELLFFLRKLKNK